MRRLAAAALVAAAASASPAAAGPVLDRVRASGLLSCGAEPRPGYAEAIPATAEGPAAARGLAVDLCRAIAVAVLGPGARIAVTLLDADRDLDALRDGRLDVAFVSGGTLLAGRLADRLLPGPVAYAESVALMVPTASAARSLGDLAGRGVCFMIGTGAQRAMEAALERGGIAVKRLGFGEEVELRDAYDVGRCEAVAGDATFLAEVRRDGGVRALRSRMLDAPLALDPVLLVTGLDDARWSAIAAVTLDVLLTGAAPRSGFSGDGAGPLAAAATPLGFRDGWYAEVTAALGTYADMRRRNLGDGSALGLAPGPNAPWPEGLLLPPRSP